MAETGGRLTAAIQCGTGAVVADPFVPTARVVELLATAAASSAAVASGRPRRGRTRRARAALRLAGGAVAAVVAVLAGAAVVAPDADAAVAKSQFGFIAFTAGANEVNELAVFPRGSDYVLRDAGAEVIAQSGCDQVALNEVVCNVGSATVSGGMVIDLGEGDDGLFANRFVVHPIIARGGPGDDVLQGSETRFDDLFGGEGDDQLSAFSGEDDLDGGPGQDRLDGGTGPDEITGGPGTDEVRYLGRTRGVTVNLDGQPGDGEPGENDTVAADVEDIRGASGLDQLTGNAAANTITGNDGTDVIRGGDGNDDLLGGEGVDTLVGDAGNDDLDGSTGGDNLQGGDGEDTLRPGLGADRVVGGPGAQDAVSYLEFFSGVAVSLDGAANDGVGIGGLANVEDSVERVFGSRGNDTLTGNDGPNALFGGDGSDIVIGGGGADILNAAAGNDTVRSADGVPDSVTCGDGSDSVQADAADAPTLCEQTIGAAQPGQGIGHKPPQILPLVKLQLADVGATRVAVRLTCSPDAEGTCRGILRLKHHGATVGAGRYQVASAKTTTVQVKLTRAARAALADRRPLDVSAQATTRDEAGHRWVTRRELTLHHDRR